jgi:hypothetical protein
MTHVIVDLNEADLVAKLKNFEDHFVERKVVKDDKDWKKTAVAFANSAPIGLPAVLYIGVRDNGLIEAPQKNLDEAQKKFNSMMEKVYPRVPYVTKIINDGGLQALAVIIPGSESRPHFGGLAYIRRGSESPEASDAQYAELIAQRNSKAHLLLQWKGKNVTVFTLTKDSEIPWPTDTVLVDCNQFYVTLKKLLHEPPISFPLSRVEINFDNLHRTLQLEILDSNRNPWDVELERHVRAVLGHAMTRDGQLLVRHLMLQGKIENGRHFVNEIPMEVQNKQIEIAIKHGIVLSEQETTGLRKAYFRVNPQYWKTLERVLPDLLR